MRWKPARAVPVRWISLLMTVALWLVYGAVAEKWPAVDVPRGLGSNILFNGNSTLVQRVPGLRWQAIDGDTVDVPGHGRVRLLGIDTPEMSSSCAREREKAQRSKARTQELLNSGPRSLHPSGERDRYNRILGDIRVNGVDIGSALLREGLARPYNGGQRQAWC